MDTDYGADADWSDDAASEFFPWATGSRVVGLDLARGLQIPTDSIEYLPNTVCLADFVESNTSDDTIVAAVERVARSDERIIEERVAVTRADNGDVTVRVIGLTGVGPFTLVMTASAAAVSLQSLTEGAS